MSRPCYDKVVTSVSIEQHKGKTRLVYNIPFLINEMSRDYERAVIDWIFPCWGCYLYSDFNRTEFESDIPEIMMPLFKRKITDLLEKAFEEKMVAIERESFLIKSISGWDHTSQSVN